MKLSISGWCKNLREKSHQFTNLCSSNRYKTNISGCTVRCWCRFTFTSLKKCNSCWCWSQNRYIIIHFLIKWVITYLWFAGELYWTDTAEDIIQKTTMDGKYFETVISNGLETADGIVIDSTGRKVIIFAIVLIAIQCFYCHKIITLPKYWNHWSIVQILKPMFKKKHVVSYNTFKY